MRSVEGGENMNVLRILVVAAVLSLSITATAHARTFVGVAVNVPPAPRAIVGPGYAWVSGHWRWNGVRRVWIGGHRIARTGYRYVPAHWARGAPGWRLRAAYRAR
jgi:hypothetical protein